MIEQATRSIICPCCGKGRRHDFKLFQASGVHFDPETQSLQDKGYQGIQKLHSKSGLPKKQPRGGKLPPQQKAYNRQLGRERVVIEHVMRLRRSEALRSLKIFRILAERNRIAANALDYTAISLLLCTITGDPAGGIGLICKKSVLEH